MDPQLSLGEPHPMPRNGTKREDPKVQINLQRLDGLRGGEEYTKQRIHGTRSLGMGRRE
jgi:hypothetical protein